RAADPLVFDLQVRNGNGHVEADLQHELRLSREPLRHDHALLPWIEVHEHARSFEERQCDLFLRWKLARRFGHSLLCPIPCKRARSQVRAAETVIFGSEPTSLARKPWILEAPTGWLRPALSASWWALAPGVRRRWPRGPRALRRR